MKIISRVVLVIMSLGLIMSLSGCKDNYPSIKIDQSPMASIVEIDLGNGSKFRTFERFDDENETKLVLYFDKNDK